MENNNCFDTCVRFTSHTSPCPYRDNQYLISIKYINRNVPENNPPEDFEKAKQICLKCESYIPKKER